MTSRFLDVQIYIEFFTCAGLGIARDAGF